MLESLETLPRALFSRNGKRLGFWAYAFLFLLCLALFTPGIATMPPTDRDESLFTQASKQMVESGNYTDIRVQKEPRYKKPIGIYWLQSTSAKLLNPDNLTEIWAYRVPSFLGATLAVLMTAALGSLLFSPTAGLLAAMMLAGCVLMNVEARLAKTDAALLGCIVTAMYALAKAYVTSGQKFRHTFRTSLLFWTAFAVGVLIKGPIILLPILGVLLWLKIADKKIFDWFKRLHPLSGLLYAAVLIAPWFIVILTQSHGAFLQQSAGNDMFAKIWQGQNRGVLVPGLHATAFPLLFFPYVLFVVFALPDIWKHRHETAVKFCLGWIVPTWIVFELSMTKLPHYVLPTYPAIAILTAHYLLEGFPSLVKSKRRLPIFLIDTVWLMIGVGFVLAFGVFPSFNNGEWLVLPFISSLALLASMGAALTLIMKKRSKRTSLMVLALGGLIFFPMTFGYTLPSLKHVWLSREIVEEALAVRPCPRSQIIALGYHEPSLVFMAGTDTIRAKTGQEAAEALTQNACRIAVVDEKHKDDFLKAFDNARIKPKEADTIRGLNAGRGKSAVLTVYLLSSDAL